MKTKGRAIAALATLLMALPLFSMPAEAVTVRSHNVVLKRLTVDSVDPSAKTITAHSESASYTIDVSKAKLRRNTGEKTRFSGLFEFLADDSITVWGKTTDDINIRASRVKNNSTQKIKGKYLATIADIAPADADFPGDIVGEFLAIRGEDQLLITIAFGYTKVKDAKNHRITYADLQAGDVVNIQGVSRTLDPSVFLIYNTTQIKVKSHGAVPVDFLPASFKFNR